MSGDVQPRKRKDKKRKKDELGVEEPRGTAAVFGEGDVFMHSPNEHGTGGHWCAKIIFFSLLAILITLIGLIILENRGLTDLDASSVESRYSGVLEGWLEEAPDDNHHDEHTLELKHHDDDGDENNHSELEHDDDNEEEHDDDHEEEHDDDNEEEHNEEEDNDDDNSDEYENDNDEEGDENNEDDDHEQDNEEDDENQNDDDEDEIEEHNYRRIYKRDVDTNEDDDDDDNEDDDNYSHNTEKDNADENDDEDSENSPEDDNDDKSEEESDQNPNTYNDVNRDDDDDDNDSEDDDFKQSIENNDDDDDKNSQELEQNDSEEQNNEDEEEHEDEPEDVEIEVEKIEKEVSEDDDVSTEVPTYVDIGGVDGESQEEDNDADGDVEEEEFLEPEDEELPVVEHITVPAGKPLTEVEDETSSERPRDTLVDEEEYEKQQEELRREQEQASHLWLKLAVGGALLAATHAVVRRAAGPREHTPATAAADTPTSDEHDSREETPSLIDRRMTLITDEPSIPVPKVVAREPYKPIEKEVIKKAPPVLKAPPPKQESEEEEMGIQVTAKTKKNVEVIRDKELYSDDEDEEEEEIVVPKKVEPRKAAPVEEKEATPEPEEPEDDDVEIIDDEQLEEELEEEDVEEEISDVDDAELLSRLEAKYGRLPEPERPERKHKDGGNSIEDEWPGEPSDPYWREQLDRAEEDLRQGEWSGAWERVGGSGAKGLVDSGRARWVAAQALDAGAAVRRDNTLLSRAITAYLHLLKMNERLTDAQLLKVTERTLDRIQFRGNYIGAEPVHRLLIRRFPDEPGYRNNLTVSFLMANRVDLAEEVLKETLKIWPNDRIALAHDGFVLKIQHNRLEEAVTAFQKALEGDTGPANEPRFYYHLGDALLLLGRFAEAEEVHKRGAALGHFLSPSQRSLYNVDRLRGRPWWNIEDTPYTKLVRSLEKSWKEILREGEAARAVFEKEKEGLKERGEWSQLDLFVRGREIAGRCGRAPVTCGIVRAEAAAGGCRRGQVKFSAMQPGTRVRAHVGPTNCRLRMHLGLTNTKDTFIRVDKEIREWKTGKVFIFDDSFEHEVWHNGTGTRLVLIVDVWHPDLTPAERRQLPAI